MRYLKYSALFGILLFATGNAQAQVAVRLGVGPVVAGIGPAPVCTYGYNGWYPYACAPYGYYGPDWFVGGVFIGAGPWYHGYYGRGFYGHPGFYRPGYGYRPGFGYRGAPARGFVGGGNAVVHGGAGFHGGGRVHGGGRR